MQEEKLVQNIFDTLKENFSSKINEICEIEITVGLLSNVDPILLESAFDKFIKEHSNYKNIKLHIKLIDIEAVCKICNKTFGIENQNFICNTCTTPSTTIVKGKELHISKVIFETSPI